MQTPHVIRARFVATCVSHFDCVALICDPLEDGRAVTSAGLAHDLQGLTAIQIQQRLRAYGVESSLDSCADLQLEVARRCEQGAAAIIEPQDQHAGPAVEIENGTRAHAPSVGPQPGGAA